MPTPQYITETTSLFIKQNQPSEKTYASRTRDDAHPSAPNSTISISTIPSNAPNSQPNDIPRINTDLGNQSISDPTLTRLASEKAHLEYRIDELQAAIERLEVHRASLRNPTCKLDTKLRTEVEWADDVRMRVLTEDDVPSSFGRVSDHAWTRWVGKDQDLRAGEARKRLIEEWIDAIAAEVGI